MLEQLPAEILALTIEEAAATFLNVDRTSLVHLAMTSRRIYALVAPLLYRKVIIKYPNVVPLSWNSNDPRTQLAAERVFRHTRELYVLDPRWHYLDVSLLHRLENLEGYFGLAVAVARQIGDEEPGAVDSPSPTPSRRLHITLRRLHLTSDYLDVIEIPSQMRKSITHLAAVYPDGGYGTSTTLMELTVDPRAWTIRVLDAFPNLTHLAFNLRPLYTQADHEVYFDVDLVAQVARAALAYPRLQIVAFRVTAGFLVCWADFLTALQVIEGSRDRLRAWLDGRQTTWAERLLEDACLDWSIWTEASPVAGLNVNT